MHLHNFILGLVVLIGCVSCADKRLDEHAVSGGDIEVRWWTTSAITSSQGHVEVAKGDDVLPIARFFHGGINDVVISQDSIILTKGGLGVIDFVEDSVFGYWVILDTIP